MNKFFIALFAFTLLTSPTLGQAEDTWGSLLSDFSDYSKDRQKERQKAAKKRRQSAFEHNSYVDDTGFEPPKYDNPFKKQKPLYFEEEKVHKDDRYIRLKQPKASVQLDTWGRNGGQNVSSQKVLEHMMSPAK